MVNNFRRTYCIDCKRRKRTLKNRILKLPKIFCCKSGISFNQRNIQQANSIFPCQTTFGLQIFQWFNFTFCYFGKEKSKEKLIIDNWPFVDNWEYITLALISINTSSHLSVFYLNIRRIRSEIILSIFLICLVAGKN